MNNPSPESFLPQKDSQVEPKVEPNNGQELDIKALSAKVLKNVHVNRFYQDTATLTVTDILPSNADLTGQSPEIAAIENLVPIAVRDMQEHIGVKPEDEVMIGDKAVAGLKVDHNGKPLLTDDNKKLMVQRIQVMRSSVKDEISKMIEEDPALAEVKLDPSTGIELNDDSLHRRTLMQYEKFRKNKDAIMDSVQKGGKPFDNVEEAFEYIAFFGTGDMRMEVLDIFRNNDGDEDSKLSAVLDMMRSQAGNVKSTIQSNNNPEARLQQISLDDLSEIKTVKQALNWIENNGDERTRKMAGMLVSTNQEMTESEMLISLRFFMAKSGKSQ